MKNDPFGNLTDWGPVLDTLEDLYANKDLSRCQPGLVRILRYKGNWRLREEVLKLVAEVENPSEALVNQVIAILGDDNLYYDVRIIAVNALLQWINNAEHVNSDDLQNNVWKVIDKLNSTPQPPFFHKAIDRLYSKLTAPGILEN